MLIDTQTEVMEILQEVGLVQKPANEKDLKELLKRHNLSPNDVLTVLSGIVHSGDNDNIKLRASEMALKMSGLLEKDVAVEKFTFNILINDPQTNFVVNPILLPR